MGEQAKMNDAMRAVKEQRATLAADVTLRPAPSTVSSVQPPLPVNQAPSPQVPQPPAPQVPQDQPVGNKRTYQEVFAKKDEAILAERLAKDAAQSKLRDAEVRADTLQNQLAEFTRAQLAAPPTPREPATKPDNWDDLADPAQAEWIATQKANEVFDKRFDEYRQRIYQEIGPTLSKHAEVTKRLEMDEALKAYPNFPLTELLPQVERQLHEVPSLTAVEAVRMVGAEYDPRVLLPADPQAPVTMPVLPSANTAAAGPGRELPAEQQGPTSDQVLGAVKQAGATGDRRMQRTAGIEYLRRVGMRRDLDVNAPKVPIPGSTG